MRQYVPPPIQAFVPAGHRDVSAPDSDSSYEIGFEEGKRAGHIAGLSEGEALGRAASSTEIAWLQAMLRDRTACNTVADALTRLLTARDADRQLLEQHLRSAVSVALTTLFPSLMSHSIGSEVVALIDQALNARTLENITIRASAETIGAITASGLPQFGSSRVTLLPDSQHADAIDVAWTGGGMTFDPPSLLRRVNEAIAPLFMRKDEEECLN